MDGGVLLAERLLDARLEFADECLLTRRHVGILQEESAAHEAELARLLAHLLLEDVGRRRIVEEEGDCEIALGILLDEVRCLAGRDGRHNDVWLAALDLGDDGIPVGVVAVWGHIPDNLDALLLDCTSHVLEYYVA